jgi:DNA-binding transcriptional LysR family regulator
MTPYERSLPRRLDFTTLQLFVAVCDLGSIQRAAEHEFIAASAVSKRITDLEATLGSSLLYRRARGVTPTPAGLALLHHARVLLFKLDKMHGEMSEYSTGVQGHVRLHANISAIVQFLPEDIAGFLAHNPDVRVGLEEHVSTQVIRAVQDGEADLGICNPQVNMAELQRLAYREDRLVLAVPRRHPFAVLPAMRFVDTLDEGHVGLPSDSALYLAMRRAAADAGKAIRLRIQVSGLDAMCRMIDNGLGIGVLPDRAFELLRSTGDLAAVPLLDDWAVRTLYLVARDFESLPVTARRLVEHLRLRPPDAPSR